jgi:hypothetical protein
MPNAPAPILNQQAFYKQYGNRFGKPGSGAYTRYVRYLRRARNPAPAPAAGGGRGAPHPAARPGGSLWAQAQGLVNKALAPVLAQTNKQYDTETASQQAAIKQATDQYRSAVSGYAPQVAAAYQRAEGAQSSSDAALAGLLGGAGAQGATDLAAQLGQPAGSAPAAALQAVGRGAAAAGYGKGSADLDKLIASGASAAQYGARLPGLAALTGYQDTRRMIGEMGRNRAADLGKIRAEGPGQALTLYQQALDRQQQMKLAKMSGLVDVATAGTKARSTQATLDERIRHDQATERNTRLSIAQRRAAAHDRVLAQQAKAAAKQTAAGKTRDAAFWAARSKVFAAAVKLNKPPADSGGYGTTTAKVARPAAFQQLWNQYGVTLIHRYHYKPQAVHVMINKALDAAGYPQPIVDAAKAAGAVAGYGQ